ncbi:MAG: tetratricopeptide repeat protein, partial [Alphaproteobacteria bacterium]
MADDSERDRLLEEANRSYEEGDFEAAFAAFSQLADAGDAPAQTKLGDMYSDGQGVAQDDAEAVRWYRLAADQGDANAQFNLGVMYDHGRGVAQDDAEAVR